MENINLILPEILLFLGICLALMVGVFFKNSFSIVMKLSILILLSVIYLILTDWGGEQKIFLESFKNDKLSGIIDYYFSCFDFYAFEIAICLNALCFEGTKENLSFNVTKAKKFIDGYSSIRKLTIEEKNSLKILCQGAAMRFLLTRVFDYINLTEGAIVTVKDPLEYLKRLEFHDSVKNYQDYFF